MNDTLPLKHAFNANSENAQNDTFLNMNISSEWHHSMLLNEIILVLCAQNEIN